MTGVKSDLYIVTLHVAFPPKTLFMFILVKNNPVTSSTHLRQVNVLATNGHDNVMLQVTLDAVESMSEFGANACL